MFKKKFLSYFFPQVIETLHSPLQGDIRIILSMGKPYIEIGGLLQSGPFLERIWHRGIKGLGLERKKINRILLLGVGGGSFIKVARKMWPDVSIIGVDFDPVIIEAGKKIYGEHIFNGSTISISDAQVFINDSTAVPTFDLIFVDLFAGFDYPAFVENADFWLKNYELLTQNGVMIFNRLYDRKSIFEADKFLDKLQQTFQYVDRSRSYSNLLIAVSKKN